MPSHPDPKECRENARRCGELAAQSKELKLKKTLADLARSWAKMATELERAEALRDASGPKRKKSG
jgi:hypothetical protein